MNLFEQTLKTITAPSETASAAAGRRLDSLTKPRGSLGHLEEIVRRYAAIRRDPEARIGRRRAVRISSPITASPRKASAPIRRR